MPTPIQYLTRGLTAAEAAEWLAGAGYQPATRVHANGDTVVVYRDTLARHDDWPTLVTVIDPTEGGGIIVAEHNDDPTDDEPDHDWAECDCWDCVEARVELAELAKVGM